jgi:predicted DNA-binding antitoxin AbrB/MazE fold protein
MVLANRLGGDSIMALEIEAIYEQGVLKLPRDLPLQEGQKVRVIIESPGGAVRRLAGLIRWSGSRDELNRYLSDPDEGALTHHEV